MYKKLKHLFDQDQHECLNQPRDGTHEYIALKIRCKARIEAAKEILESGAAFSGIDYFHACIIFMHGNCPDDFWQAHGLALKAVDSDYSHAKSFAAAAYDKWLMYQGMPQKYGTQYVPDGIGLRLWDVDPTTTDEERVTWDLPTMAELQKKVVDMNKTFDPSTIDMDSKPSWLKEAIKRWNSVD
jgi:hypothetical protein